MLKDNHYIKLHVDYYRLQIKDAQERITELQNQCSHENTHVGLYSWRIACFDDAKICSDCGKLIEILNQPPIQEYE